MVAMAVIGTMHADSPTKLRHPKQMKVMMHAADGGGSESGDSQSRAAAVVTFVVDVSGTYQGMGAPTVGRGGDATNRPGTSDIWPLDRHEEVNDVAPDGIPAVVTHSDANTCRWRGAVRPCARNAAVHGPIVVADGDRGGPHKPPELVSTKMATDKEYLYYGRSVIDTVRVQSDIDHTIFFKCITQTHNFICYE
jgi:hypothetical protein